jgi:hypothetical protein
MTRPRASRSLASSRCRRSASAARSEARPPDCPSRLRGEVACRRHEIVCCSPVNRVRFRVEEIRVVRARCR